MRAHILDHVWRDEFTVSEIPAPHRIAPDAMALDATVCEGDRSLGQGRLIILHDPEAPEAWQGTTRLVTVARAEVDLEMATDPLLSGVARSWLTDALDNLKAPYTCLAGTATSVVSRSFGGLDDKPQESRIELRASWTPSSTTRPSSTPTWRPGRICCATSAGFHAADPGVVMLRRHRRWEADA